MQNDDKTAGQPPAGASDSSRKPSEDPVSPPTVLVADDDPQNLDLAVRWLQRAGCRCLAANSGDRALYLIRDRMPDLVLLDVMMPGMNGYAVCENMKQDPLLAQIPVIFVTAHSDPRERVRGLRMGAVDYVSKPYHSEELVARVYAALRSKEERDLLVERARLLEEQSIRDPLTGLHNRRWLTERLAQEMARAERYGLILACLVIDIDYFKRVNDTLGHAMGDDLLRAVAGTISSSTRRSDIVARYGGEEFVVVLPQTGPEEAFEMAERIRLKVSTLRVPSMDRRLSISVGVACYPGPGVNDMVTLINSADQALLRAKATGRNHTELAGAASTNLPGVQDAAAGPSETSENSRRILIVEDEPNNQILLQKVLGRLGYEWICVGDGNEAVAEVNARPFGLILMDLSLPDLDGWEATRIIRRAGHTVPIVATSAHAMASDKQKALEAGCTEYLTKPFHLPDLRRVVEKYVPLHETSL